MSRRAWLLFAAISVLWGLPYLFIKIAVVGLDPVALVWLRTAGAAAVLMPLAMRSGALRGLGRRWVPLVVLALVEVVAPFLLITYGEQRVHSSTAGLLVAAEPLAVAVLALRFDRSERVNRARFTGLVVGVVGVAVLVGVDASTTASVAIGAAMILGAAICYGAGVLLVKQCFTGVSSFGVASAMLTVTAVGMAPVGILSLPAAMPRPSVVASTVVLAVACTAIAYVVYFGLVAAAGAAKAAVITYVNPAVAVSLGVVVLGEPLTAATVAGFLLIIAGSWFATGGTLPPSAQAVVARTVTRSPALVLRRLRRLPDARTVPLPWPAGRARRAALAGPGLDLSARTRP